MVISLHLSASISWFCPPGQLGLDLNSLEFFLDVFVGVVDIPRYGAYTLLFVADCKGLISGLDFVRVLSYFQDPRRWPELIRHLSSSNEARRLTWDDENDYL